MNTPLKKVVCLQLSKKLKVTCDDDKNKLVFNGHYFFVSKTMVFVNQPFYHLSQLLGFLRTHVMISFSFIARMSKISNHDWLETVHFSIKKP